MTVSNVNRPQKALICNNKSEVSAENKKKDSTQEQTAPKNAKSPMLKLFDAFLAIKDAKGKTCSKDAKGSTCH